MPKYYTHPGLTDVCFELLKAFYVKEKDIYKLKIVWYHRKKRHMLAYDKLVINPSKYREFILLQEFIPKH